MQNVIAAVKSDILPVHAPRLLELAPGEEGMAEEGVDSRAVVKLGKCYVM